MFCELPCFYKIGVYCCFNYSNVSVYGNVMRIEESILVFLSVLVQNSCFGSQLQLPTFMKQIRSVVWNVLPAVSWIRVYGWY